MTGGGTLFVGLGTPHGDDRIGLCVAEQLAARAIPGVKVHLARTPGELLDWLNDADCLVVCDACRSEKSPIGTLHEWKWPAAEIEDIRFSGSHDLPLPAVLTLAERLGRRPKEVVILGVEVGKIEPDETMAPELKSAIPTILKHVRGVLENA